MPLEQFGETTVPSGTIAYWDDDASTIPSGWVVCDGNNGTPNLLDRYTKGVPDSSTSPGATGGQASYTMSEAQMGPHDHSLSNIDTVGDHQHVVYENANVEDGNTGSPWGQRGQYRDGTVYTNSGGGHSHPINDDTAGSANSVDNHPSYVELVPMMKV